MVLVDEGEQVEDFPVIQAVRLGSPGGRHYRRVEYVQVDGYVYVVFEQGRYPVGPFVVITEFVGVENPFRYYVVVLFGSGAADAYLHYRCGRFLRPCHHACVVVGRALVFAAHVGVRVQLEHRKLLITFCKGSERSDAHRMLAAYEYGEFSVVEEFADTFFNLCRHRFRRRGFGYRFNGSYAFGVYLRIRFYIIEFHVGGGFEQGFRSFVRSFNPCACTVVWYRKYGYGRSGIV